MTNFDVVVFLSEKVKKNTKEIELIEDINDGESESVNRRIFLELQNESITKTIKLLEDENSN